MKVLDEVYMMILPKNRGIVYGAMGPDRRVVWDSIASTEYLGTGMDEDTLRALGYKVKKVKVCL